MFVIRRETMWNDVRVGCRDVAFMMCLCNLASGNWRIFRISFLNMLVSQYTSSCFRENWRYPPNPVTFMQIVAHSVRFDCVSYKLLSWPNLGKHGLHSQICKHSGTKGQCCVCFVELQFPLIAAPNAGVSGSPPARARALRELAQVPNSQGAAELATVAPPTLPPAERRVSCLGRSPRR